MLLHVNEAGIYGGQNKIGVYMYIMWALQYIHDNLSKWHIDCWALHTDTSDTLDSQLDPDRL